MSDIKIVSKFVKDENRFFLSAEGDFMASKEDKEKLLKEIVGGFSKILGVTLEGVDIPKIKSSENPVENKKITKEKTEKIKKEMDDIKDKPKEKEEKLTYKKVLTCGYYKGKTLSEVASEFKEKDKLVLFLNRHLDYLEKNSSEHKNNEKMIKEVKFFLSILDNKLDHYKNIEEVAKILSYEGIEQYCSMYGINVHGLINEEEERFNKITEELNKLAEEL